MFRDPTVLIVGAGGGVDFGLPTGQQIHADLLKENPDTRTDNFNIYKDIFDADFITFARQSDLGIDSNAVRTLIDKAKKDFSPSIDLFSYNNEDVLEVSKIYSTRKILAGLYSPKIAKDVREASRVGPTYIWRDPRINGRDSWITHLVRKFTEGCESLDDLKKNKLKVVTFNYDSIFEDAFFNILKGATRYSAADKTVCPKTYHVYGKFPELKSHLSSSDIIEASKAIKYMFEASNNLENNEIDVDLLNIQESLKKAAYVYVIGFDADPRNTGLIGLDKCDARIFASNYAGKPKLQSRLIAIGADAGHIFRGQLGDACEAGFFDLMDLHPNPKYQMFVA